MKVLNACLIVNGVYDIFCALAILYFPLSLPGRLHLSVFKETAPSPLMQRILAYWIFTYGVDRVGAGLYASDATDALALASYLVEAVAYYNEAAHGSVHVGKARFVYLASVALAIGVRFSK